MQRRHFGSPRSRSVSRHSSRSAGVVLRQRDAVAGHERAPLPAADPAADISRDAAKDRGDIEATLDGDVQHGAADQRPDAHDLTALQAYALHCVDARSACFSFFVIDIDRGLCADEGEPDAFGFDHQRRSEVSHLQSARGTGIADERICGPQTKRVERAADRNAEMLVAGAAEVLDRRQEAGRMHAE